jgi:hypothetical protein
MAITKPQLKSLIASQLPEFVREDYDQFVTFLQAYYEFLESTQVDLLTTRDLDKTLDDFITYFKDELALKLPYSTVDQRFLLQHIKDHYLAKGSESSYKLLFKILFNKEVTVDYPAKQMLRASDGKWNQDVSIFVKILQGHPNDIVGKLVDIVTTSKVIRVLVDRRQYVEVEVDRAVFVSDDIYEFFIDRRFFGNISVGDRIRFRDDANAIYFSGEILTTTAGLQVQVPGTGFKVGDIYNVKNYNGYGSILKVSAVDSNGGIAQAQFIKYGIGYTTDFTTTISSVSGQDVAGTAGTVVQRVDQAITNTTLSGTLSVTNNSTTVTGSSSSFTSQVAPGDYLFFPNGYYTVQSVTNSTTLVLTTTYKGATASGLTSVARSRPGGGVNSFVNLSITEGLDGFSENGSFNYADYNLESASEIAADIATYGSVRGNFLDGAFAGLVIREFGISSIDATATSTSPAIIKVSLGPLAKYPGYYINNDGFLNDAIYIQDSYYYQSYSYVIKIDETLNSYKTTVKNLIHPAGMAIFGEYDIRNEFDIGLTLESMIKILSVTVNDGVLTSSGVGSDLQRTVPYLYLTKPLDGTTLNYDGNVLGESVTINEFGIALDGTRTMPYLDILKPLDSTTLTYLGTAESQDVTMQETTATYADSSTRLGANVFDFTKLLSLDHYINDGVTTDSESVIMDETGNTNDLSRTLPYFAVGKTLDNTTFNYDNVLDNNTQVITEDTVSMGYSSLTRIGVNVIGTSKLLDAVHYLYDGTTIDNETQLISDTDALSATDLNRTYPAFALTTTLNSQYFIVGSGTYAGDDNVLLPTSGESGSVDLNPYVLGDYFLNDGGQYLGVPYVDGQGFGYQTFTGAGV